MPRLADSVPADPGQRMADGRALQDRHLPWIGAALALMVFAAFTPTYFVPVAAGQFDRPSILHVHGALFFAWPVLFVVQAFLAARGRIQTHRSLGLLGIALATADGLLGPCGHGQHAAAGGAGRIARGRGTPWRWSHSPGLMFAVFVAAAVVYRHRRDIHQRLMLLATARHGSGGVCAVHRAARDGDGHAAGQAGGGAAACPGAGGRPAFAGRRDCARRRLPVRLAQAGPRAHCLYRRGLAAHARSGAQTPDRRLRRLARRLRDGCSRSRVRNGRVVRRKEAKTS